MTSDNITKMPWVNIPNEVKPYLYIQATNRNLPENEQLTAQEQEILKMVYGRNLGIEPDKNRLYCLVPMSQERFDQLANAEKANGMDLCRIMRDASEYFVLPNKARRGELNYAKDLPRGRGDRY